jgi:hypothetical protein
MMRTKESPPRKPALNSNLLQEERDETDMASTIQNLGMLDLGCRIPEEEVNPA